MLFADAVHPTHEARPAGCWAPKDAKVAIEQTSGRQRLNIHGAIDLESGATRMIDVATVDALSTIALLMAIVLMYPGKRLIVFSTIRSPPRPPPSLPVPDSPTPGPTLPPPPPSPPPPPPSTSIPSVSEKSACRGRRKGFLSPT